MRSRAQALILGLFLVLVMGVIACGGGGEQVNEMAEAEYAWLTENKAKLDAARQELAELRTQAEMEAAAAEEAEDEDEGEETAEGEGEEAAGPSLQDQIAEKEQEILDLSGEMVQRVVGYLNEHDPMLEGEPPSERQIEVIRMKSDEDMVVAGEYIERGGDYKRAITIYQDALKLDPENTKLQEGLARAEELRFMSAERLALVKKGMSEDEVREALGPVNLRNIREYPERNVIAWFYPVDETGAASAVWFRENRDGDYTVYKTEFEQVKGRDTAPEEES